MPVRALLPCIPRITWPGKTMPVAQADYRDDAPRFVNCVEQQMIADDELPNLAFIERDTAPLHA